MLSLVTRAAPESISDSTFSPSIDLHERVHAQLGHLGGELRHGGVLDAGLQGFLLAAAEVETDQNDGVVGNAGVLDRLRGARCGRTTSGVDGLEVGIRRQKILGNVDPQLLRAVRWRPGRRS